MNRVLRAGLFCLATFAVGGFLYRISPDFWDALTVPLSGAVAILLLLASVLAFSSRRFGSRDPGFAWKAAGGALVAAAVATLWMGFAAGFAVLVIGGVLVVVGYQKGRRSRTTRAE